MTLIIQFTFPTAGMLGPLDPQWQRSLAASGDAIPTARRAVSAPMFGQIGQFEADDAIFNNAGGSQYNYNLTPSPPGRSIMSCLPYSMEFNTFIPSPSFSTCSLPITRTDRDHITAYRPSSS